MWQRESRARPRPECYSSGNSATKQTRYMGSCRLPGDTNPAPSRRHANPIVSARWRRRFAIRARTALRLTARAWPSAAPRSDWWQYGGTCGLQRQRCAVVGDGIVGTARASCCRSHGVSSQPWISPLSPQSGQCHSIYPDVRAGRAMISPRQRRRPGLRRQGTFVYSSPSGR